MMRRDRPGFTLIEMLIVVGIVLVLAVIAVPITLRMMERDNVSEGAKIVMGAIGRAKGLALHDRNAAGIRLLVVNGRAEQIEFIEDPGPFNEGYVTANGMTVTNGVLGFSFAGLVRGGDTIEFNGGGQVYQIAQDPTGPTLTLARPVAYPVPAPSSGQSNYRIFRQPQPVAGEKPIKLPADVIIDVTASLGWERPPPPGGHYDILFGPSGRVVGDAAQADLIALMLEDTSQGNQDNKEIVAVFTKTGGAARYIVNQTGDPFQFAKEGRGSGGR